MTIIEQIKAEIERQEKQCPLDTYEGRHKLFILGGLKTFLSTLKSEKPMQEDLEKELDKWRHEHFHGKRDNLFSGEYLERTSQLDFARHFAQWGAEHLKQ